LDCGIEGFGQIIPGSGRRGTDVTRMKVLAAVNWTAVGSVATGVAAIAAFLAIVATVAVYYLQSRGDKVAAIRRNLQFLHGQQAQIVPSIKSGLLAIIDRQIRGFRERLGPGAMPSYLLDELFGSGQSSRDRLLFLASALDSNLSSTAYSRMSDIWDELNMKARDCRGALRLFAFACQVLTWESRRLCDPETTIGLLDIMAKRGDRDALSKIDSTDELANRLLSDQIELAKELVGDSQGEIERIGQGCFFIGMLADVILRLSDKKVLRLARKELRQPGFDMLEKRPRKAIEASLANLQSTLPENDLRGLEAALDHWDPQPEAPEPKP
jgi:hypothetical protein